MFLKLIGTNKFFSSYSYGTGAIMAVPAHDTRDHEFALKYDIPICWVVTPNDINGDDFEKPYPGEGLIINSSSSTTGLDINGLSSKVAASKVIEWAEKTVHGKKKVFISFYNKLLILGLFLSLSLNVHVLGEERVCHLLVHIYYNCIFSNSTFF